MKLQRETCVTQECKIAVLRKQLGDTEKSRRLAARWPLAILGLRHYMQHMYICLSVADDGFANLKWRDTARVEFYNCGLLVQQHSCSRQ